MDNAILTGLDIFDADTSRQIHDTVEHAVVLKPEFSVFHEPGLPRPMTKSVEVSDYQRGITAGEENANALNATTIAVMQSALLNIQSSVSQLATQIAEDHFDLMGDCLIALCPVLLEHETKQALLSILKTQYVSSYSGVVTVQCHADNVSFVETLCADIDTDSRAAFIVRELESLSPGQFSLQWKSGGARLDNVTVAQEILRRCHDVLPSDPYPNHTIIPVMETSDDI